MNSNEKRMLTILEEACERYGVLAVKAEFEAEGTRTDELLRLLEIARRAGVKVGLKIGGCEAIRDLIECRQFGVDYIIAPMVETPYALKKYINAKNAFYTLEEQAEIGFLFNLETRSAFNHLDELGQLAQEGRVGMVFGRTDFAGSMGKTRDFVNSDDMTAHVVRVGEVARDRNLDFVVGGGVSTDSIEPLRGVRRVRLDRFETRKVIFDAAVLDGNGAARGMDLAIEFELLWLKNKRDYYHTISTEDANRIAMMEARQKVPVKEAA